MNKNKIINDPVYGFITIPSELIFDIIEHRYFQRLRRIKQLGISDFVYPGAIHTRFHHAIGAMHLMSSTLENLRLKGNAISDQEYEGALLAILLHDVGHGPLSHSLEFNLVPGVSHEEISLIIFNKLNVEFNGSLKLAIDIFTGNYHRPFFHQLVSSQLDIDRLDYLKRDSFFTGVSEGTIGADRIIKMLDVHDDELVVEEKGIYSVENFLSARRLMYWQVYLHKTSLSAESMLTQIVARAKKITRKGIKVVATPALEMFLERDFKYRDFTDDSDSIELYCLLDDTDIWGSMKIWISHPDKVLSTLSQMLLSRQLFKVKLSNNTILKDKSEKQSLRKAIANKYGLSEKESKYFLIDGTVSNAAYVSARQTINIQRKNGEVIDVALATDLPNIKAMRKIVKKNYLCYPKSI